MRTMGVEKCLRMRVASSECKMSPLSFLSATDIINAVVQMNRETQGDKQAGVPCKLINH